MGLFLKIGPDIGRVVNRWFSIYTVHTRKPGTVFAERVEGAVVFGNSKKSPYLCTLTHLKVFFL